MFLNCKFCSGCEFLLLHMVTKLHAQVFLDAMAQSQREARPVDKACGQVPRKAAANLEVYWNVPGPRQSHRPIQGNHRPESVAQPRDSKQLVQSFKIEEALFQANDMRERDS